MPPFHPNLEAGTINNAAGTYSPFYVHLSRKDSEQEITRFSIKLPPGVIGKLAGVSSCSDAGVAAAKAREHEGGGTEEEQSPSCPANSEVGHSPEDAPRRRFAAVSEGLDRLTGPGDPPEAQLPKDRPNGPGIPGPFAVPVQLPNRPR